MANNQQQDQSMLVIEQENLEYYKDISLFIFLSNKLQKLAI